MSKHHRPLIPAWLQGLDTRIARVLIWQGINNVDELATAVSTGVDIPRIRAHSLGQIRIWLAARGIHIEISPSTQSAAMPKRDTTKEPSTENRPVPPHALLDYLHTVCTTTSDAKLARALEVSSSTLSKIRNDLSEVTPLFILRAHDATGIAIKELKKMATKLSQPIHSLPNKEKQCQ